MKELILIVDDEPGILATLSNILQDEGYRILTSESGEQALELYRQQRPDVVFLDIWLADKDGLETLQAMLEIDPEAAVIMMSGHGTAATAVKSIKMGAYDYLEKPLSYDQAVGAVVSTLEEKRTRLRNGSGGVLELGRERIEHSGNLTPPPRLAQVAETEVPQRTIKTSTVIYGLGLHSGSRTGMVLQPLPPDSGIHFVTLPKGTLMPAHISCVADTEWATSLCRAGEHIRTVEHLLSALHACGITNLLIKVHGEIPVLDGSALEFCKRIVEIGIEDQDRARHELIIDRRYEINGGRNKSLVVEPAEQLSVSYDLRYPPPVGEQQFEFQLTSFADYMAAVAPARTFGFMRDLKMINELGLGSGGRLDNFILVGEDNVINTELRFPDEFVRHKVLDIIGDFYLLGYPVRAKITARLTGHQDNILLQRQILEAGSSGGVS